MIVSPYYHVDSRRNNNKGRTQQRTLPWKEILATSNCQEELLLSPQMPDENNSNVVNITIIRRNLVPTRRPTP